MPFQSLSILLAEERRRAEKSLSHKQIPTPHRQVWYVASNSAYRRYGVNGRIKLVTSPI
jgi:hypothetical protein